MVSIMKNGLNKFSLVTVCIASLISPAILSAGPVSLMPDEILQMRALIGTNAVAQQQFAGIHKAADRALDDKPDPIEKVISEGHLQKDPLKIRSEAAMNDRNKINSLAWAWAATGDERYAATAREFILAWAKVNKADGDAINETEFEPVIEAYDLLRGSFSEADRQTVDIWLQNKADVLWNEYKNGGKGHWKGNFVSHGLKIIGLVGLTLGNESLTKDAMDGFRTHIKEDLEPDGSTTDFHVRDAMHYHIYSIEPLLTLARAGERHGEHLFDYKGPNGASLQSAVDFIVPFADRKKSHLEFANSKSSFDRKRASNGEKEYQPHPWSPKSSIVVFSKAAWFNPEYGKLAAKIDGKPNETFINWHMVINAISQPTHMRQ